MMKVSLQLYAHAKLCHEMPVPFNKKGLLPRGLQKYSFDEVVQQFAFTPRRLWLLSELRKFIPQSEIAKASHEVWIDGSFAETKPEPKDIDVLFIQQRFALSEKVLSEIVRFGRAEYLSRLKNVHGIGFNQSAVDEEMYPDFYLKWFGFQCDWTQADPKPNPKGIILVRL